jgi:EpsI family protein
MRDYRLYLPAAVLLAGAAFVWNARSQAAIPLAAPLSGIMAQVDGYRVEDQRLSDEERRVAGMSQYVARIYWRDSVAAFTTFVSYYERQTQGKTIHSPRNCLPGAGWEILTVGTDTLLVNGVPQIVNRNLLKNQGSSAVVYYWYQGRGRIVANEYAVKWNLLRDAAVAGHTEEALVRVVVPVRPAGNAPGDADADRALADANALGKGIATRIAQETDRVLPKA